MFMSFPRIQKYSIMRNIIVRKCETASGTLIKQTSFPECKKQWLALSFGNLTTILGGSYYLNNKLNNVTTDHNYLKKIIENKVEVIELNILNANLLLGSGLGLINYVLCSIASIITIQWIVVVFYWF